jgi:NAD(P)-dependent dehydrogenase (short-subunit alcohol dehydrogenase family)
VTLSLDAGRRRVLVTGAGQGLGRGLALAFAAASGELVVNDIRAERADALADEIRSLHGSACPASFDVTDFDVVLAGIAESRPVDVLVNNAGNAGVRGSTARKPFARTGPDDWEPFLQVNLYGVRIALARLFRR